MDIPNGYGIATMHWRQSGGLTDITCTQAYDWRTLDEDPGLHAESIESYWITGSVPAAPALMLQDWTFVGVSVLERNEDGVLLAGDSYLVTPGTLTNTGGTVPAYTPTVVTKRTNFAGVQYRGRMYPPLTQIHPASVDDLGQIDGAYLNSLQDYYDATFALWSGGNLLPVLLHSVPEGGGSAPAPTPVISWQVQPNVAIQRRRKNR